MQRTDRDFHLSNWLYFGNPIEDTIDASFVVREGTDGYACYVKGNENAVLPTEQVWGYVDGSSNSFFAISRSLTDYHSLTYTRAGP